MVGMLGKKEIRKKNNSCEQIMQICYEVNWEAISG